MTEKIDRPQNRNLKPFQKGRPKTGGRKKGTPNRLPREFNEFCRELVSDPDYQDKVRQRAMKGRLHAGVEKEIIERGAGRLADVVNVHQTTTETIDVSVTQTLRLETMTDE